MLDPANEMAVARRKEQRTLAPQIARTKANLILCICSMQAKQFLCARGFSCPFRSAPASASAALTCLCSQPRADWLQKLEMKWPLLTHAAVSRWRKASFLRHSPRRWLNIFQAVEQHLLDSIDVDHIRNFSVIAHVDHGKSTLSDAILNLTGNISESDRKKGQVLDTLKVERERGITVKANTASMIYDDSRTGERYLLNLIDTPGHIDFAYEVSRSLASCQGALLLVDSTQSIQAQTLSNHGKACALGLKFIPIVTKIDLPSAQPLDAAITMASAFHIDPEKVIMTSAKKGVGIEEVLHSVIDDLPSPLHTSHSLNNPFCGRIIDSWFDEHRGVVMLVQVVGGKIVEGNRFSLYASLKDTLDIDHKTEFSVQEVGILTPQPLRTGSLRVGQVGYVIGGLRSTRQARIGDTMFLPAEWSEGTSVQPLPGYESAKPMLYASLYPVDTRQLDGLFAAVDKLILNDSSVSVTRELSSTLGAGLRCGFLGFLHMEVFTQRLKDEFNMDIVMTTPSVPYKIQMLKQFGTNRISFNELAAAVNLSPDQAELEGNIQTIHCVSEWPRGECKFIVHEPMVTITIITPQQYFGAMVEIIKDRRGSDVVPHYMEDGNMIITACVPWQEVVCDMHDQIKHSSAGYASFNYETAGYQAADLVKVEIAVNGEACEPLSFVAHRAKAVDAGRKMAIKLKEVLTRQQFEIVIQARVGSKVLARERIAPYRKDVLIKSGKVRDCTWAWR